MNTQPRSIGIPDPQILGDVGDVSDSQKSPPTSEIGHSSDGYSEQKNSTDNVEIIHFKKPVWGVKISCHQGHQGHQEIMEWIQLTQK